MEGTTAAQRDEVFRAFMYFVNRSARSKPPQYDTVVANLPQFGLTGIPTADRPLSLRIASGQQLGYLLRFLERHAPTIWEDAANEIGDPKFTRFFLSIEGKGYFSMNY